MLPLLNSGFQRAVADIGMVWLPTVKFLDTTKPVATMLLLEA